MAISELAIAFINLLILTRIMGRKELSQMNYFNYVSCITICAIACVLVIDSNVSI